MEDNQLDFNQPFLSVRRFPSTLPSEKDDKRNTDKNPRPPPAYRSELKSGPISNPGAVPFMWEQSPGRPKDERKPHSKSLERPPVVPRLPPGRALKVNQQALPKVSEAPISQDVSSSKETVGNLETVPEKDSSDSEDVDEAYADALDTLSRTESVFLNCSVTGMSGFNSSEVVGTFSTDPQTRDFMMSRFLPAAKAMASETPSHVPRKQLVWDQPRQVKEATRPPVYRSRPNTLPNYEDHTIEEESDDEDDAYDNPKHLSGAVCGLLPRFCLLNPLPAMSVRTRVPRSPVNRKQPRPSPSPQVATQEPRFARGSQKRDEDRRRDDKLNQIQKLEGSSLYKRLQGSGESPKRNESPRSNVYEEAQAMKNSDFSSAEVYSNNTDQITEMEIGSATPSPLVEKTLYIDYVQKATSPKVGSFSSDGTGLPNFIKNRNVVGLEETPSVDSFHKEFEEDMLQPKSVSPTDSSLLTCSGQSDHEVGSGHDRVPSQELLSSTELEFTKNGLLDYEDQQKPSKLGNLELSKGMALLFPLPPPPPKSPSESWLWRTLPSLSSKATPRSHLGTHMNGRYQASKTSDQKWETIVKTTKM